MKINNLNNRGFMKLSVLVFMVVMAAVLLSVSCSGSDNKKTVLKETERTAEEIKDSSMAFSEDIVKTTCLECHPEVKDGGFNIDFTKVKTSSVAHQKDPEAKKAEFEYRPLPGKIELNPI